MGSGLVSIVLPIYNGEKYMRQSIDSIINQTYTNWELIIIDDCSTDQTPVIAKEYAEKDDRINYYRNEVNLKLPKGLNKGFSLSKGQYLTWTSDDNLYKPNAIEVMLEYLKNKNVNLVYAASEIIDENGVKTGQKFTSSGDSKRDIFNYNCVGACFLYTRKVYEVVGNYNADRFLGEDYDYWLRVFANFDVFYIDQLLYDYRMHSNNLTNSQKKEKIYKAVEESLLDNVKLFGKLDCIQKFYFYSYLLALQKYKKDQSNAKKYRIKRNLYYPIFIIYDKFISKK